MSFFFGAQFTKSNRDVNNEKATCNSFSIIIRDQYFVFITVTGENPFPHKLIVTKESKTFIVLSDNARWSFFFFTSIQKWRSLH